MHIFTYFKSEFADKLGRSFTFPFLFVHDHFLNLHSFFNFIFPLSRDSFPYYGVDWTWLILFLCPISFPTNKCKHNRTHIFYTGAKEVLGKPNRNLSLGMKVILIYLGEKSYT